MSKIFITILISLAFNLGARAAETFTRLEVEAGLITTKNIEIRGFQQQNATASWRKSAATWRLEYWRVNQDGWNFGAIYQPLSLNYSDFISNDLNAKGKSFLKRAPATLEYQFPTLRFSANYPIFKNPQGDYIRLGGSAIMRYAKVELRSAGTGFSDTNFIAIPVANFELKKGLGHAWSLFARADFLPGIQGSVFLDGLFDVFAGFRRELTAGKHLDLGIRSFFGGYDPAKRDDYANRIFFNSAVARFAW